MAPRRKITLPDLLTYKRHARKLPILTAYDYPTARLLDSAGVPAILVGDSVGMAVLGYKTTVPVTLDEMIHHCRAVSRGVEYAFVIGDLPFGSYQASVEDAIRSGARLLKDGGVEAVKLEGGREAAAAIRALVDAGMVVVGHIGLTPQSVSKLGGYRVQGRDAERASALIQDAEAVEAAGASLLVLEMVPAPVAKRITETVGIPTIGIGAGADCDGQVLVLHDMLGLIEGFQPRFVKRYRELAGEIIAAAQEYCADVESGAFPGPEHAFVMPEAELLKLDRERDTEGPDQDGSEPIDRVRSFRTHRH